MFILLHRNMVSLLGCLLAVGLAACSADVAATGDAGIRDGESRLTDEDLASLPDSAPAPPDLAPLGPPYPLVLVHGMAGFRKVGPIDYFYGVPEALRKDGHDVWVSQQDPLNTSEVRGPELASYVQMVLASTGKAKVNLIGHSQGGFDVRYVASVMGDRVASVTTIAAPMGGTPIADVAVGVAPGPLQDALGALLDLYGAAGGYTSDVKAQLQNLTTSGAAAFFARHPDDPRVAYYSIAGRSERMPGDGDCQTSTGAPFVTRWDPELDTLDPLFAIPAGILDNLRPRPLHDGLVSVASARHGRFLGCIPADHMGEVGQPIGNAAGPGNAFDYLRFYRDLAAWLVEQGD